MELLKIMKNRRSVRKYTDEKIPQKKLRMILQAGLLAPSSRNIRPVEFIVVEDKDTLKKLAKSKSAGSGMIADAACAVVVIGNASKADAWIEDCSLALGNMLLMAEDLGIGACWVQIRLRKTLLGKASGAYVKNVLGIPDSFEVEAILSLGIAQKSESPRSWDKTEQDKIHLEKF
ncbi:MAG: nitroreductase family protein [Ruminococcus sp.]|nr:nitroreductase family protein [Ruminococcus sp.]